VGIEFSDGFDLVAEELEADGPRRAEGPDIDDAAAPRQFPFVGDLGFGFIPLLLEPFDEVEGIESIAGGQTAEARAEVGGGERPLQHGGDGRDEDRGMGRAFGLGDGAESDQRFQAFADDIRVRELLLVRQELPGGEKPRVERIAAGESEPRGEIGVKDLLDLEVGEHHENGSLG
jgi:hypothetical protein